MKVEGRGPSLYEAMLAEPQDESLRLIYTDFLKENDGWLEPVLLGMVLEEKKADPPRLLYAQWCEENGRPERGEFIRVQCKLAGMDLRSDPDGTVREHLRRRERELWGRHCREWINICEGPHPWEFLAANLWQYRRGFVEQVCLSVKTWISCCDHLLSICPISDVVIADKDFHSNDMPPAEESAMRKLIEAAYDRVPRSSVSPMGWIGLLGGDLVALAWPGIKFWTILSPPGIGGGPWAGSEE